MKPVATRPDDYPATWPDDRAHWRLWANRETTERKLLKYQRKCKEMLIAADGDETNADYLTWERLRRKAANAIGEINRLQSPTSVARALNVQIQSDASLEEIATMLRKKAVILIEHIQLPEEKIASIKVLMEILEKEAKLRGALQVRGGANKSQMDKRLAAAGGFTGNPALDFAALANKDSPAHAAFHDSNSMDATSLDADLDAMDDGDPYA